MADSGGGVFADDFDFHNPDVDIDDDIDISPIPMSTQPSGGGCEPRGSEPSKALPYELEA